MELHPGMVTAIEPGIYRPGQWGSRIENIAAVVAAPDVGFGEFLAFETLTLCPIDTRCLEPGLLDNSEIEWFNAYHAMVRERLQSQLEGQALHWLIARTEPLARAVCDLAE
jgi:Xaa-Pro aminopeptidase